MCLIPNFVAGERPRCADADEEVAFRLTKQIANEDEQDSHGRQHGSAYTEVCVTQVPAQGQSTIPAIVAATIMSKTTIVVVRVFILFPLLLVEARCHINRR